MSRTFHHTSMNSFDHNRDVIWLRNIRRSLVDAKRNSHFMAPKHRNKNTIDLIYCVRRLIDDYRDHLYSNWAFWRLVVSMTEDLWHPIYDKKTLKWIDQIMNYDSRLTELYIREWWKDFLASSPDTLLLEYKPSVVTPLSQETLSRIRNLLWSLLVSLIPPEKETIAWKLTHQVIANAKQYN